jgi:hypothetical protein
MKYTKEVLEPIVRVSFSVAEVTRRMGLRNPNGGTNGHLSKVIKKLGLDTSHFRGKRNNWGPNHKGGSERLTPEKVLVYNRFGVERKESTDSLRRAMIESGIPHICGTCGIGPEWHGKILVLQISHKNGNSLDNQKNNLHFQCPNCHSQTDDFAGRGACKNKRPLLVERQTHLPQEQASEDMGVQISHSGPLFNSPIAQWQSPSFIN